MGQWLEIMRESRGRPRPLATNLGGPEQPVGDGRLVLGVSPATPWFSPGIDRGGERARTGLQPRDRLRQSRAGSLRVRIVARGVGGATTGRRPSRKTGSGGSPRRNQPHSIG